MLEEELLLEFDMLPFIEELLLLLLIQVFSLTPFTLKDNLCWYTFEEVELIPEITEEIVKGRVNELKEYYCPLIRTLTFWPEFLNYAV